MRSIYDSLVFVNFVNSNIKLWILCTVEDVNAVLHLVGTVICKLSSWFVLKSEDVGVDILSNSYSEHNLILDSVYLATKLDLLSYEIIMYLP